MIAPRQFFFFFFFAPAQSVKEQFARDAEETAQRERSIQAKIDRAEQAKGERRRSRRPCRPARGSYPMPPFPKQHLPSRAWRALDPRPMYDAPHYKGSEKLAGMVALITGGDSGIGRAVAVLYAREGADVAIAYLNEHEDAEETKRAVENEGRRCILIAGDVADPEVLPATPSRAPSTSSASSTSWSTTPRFRSTSSAFEDLTEEHFDRTLKTNLYGYFHMAQGGGAAHEARQRHRHDRLGDRHLGQQVPARLFDDQGRHPCLHALARDASRRPRHPRQRGRAGPGLDAAQSGRQGRRSRSPSSAPTRR